MTISNTDRKKSVVPNGSTGPHSFSFKITSSDQLKCYQIDPDTYETLATLVKGGGSGQYSVSINSTTEGGSVTLGSSLAATFTTGLILLIVRDVDNTQSTSVPVGNAFPEKSVENALDKLTMRDIEIEESIGRGLTVPLAVSGFSGELDSLIAGRGIKINDAGTGFTLTDSDPDTVIETASAYADAAQTSADAAQVSADAAAASYDSFDDRYLGAKAADPTLDNDGNALITGAVYFNTTTGWRIYNGSAWISTAFNSAIISADGTFSFVADITPSQLTANTDNWNPTGLSTASVIRVSTDASRDLTGIAGGTDGRIIMLSNVGSYNLVIKHDATSTAANRFYCPNASDLTLQPKAGVLLRYDATGSRWAVIDVGYPPTATTSASGIVELATDAETKTGTDTGRVPAVSSIVQHDGVAKAFGLFNGSPGSPTWSKSYNFGSITKNATGDFTLPFTTAMDSANYVVGLSFHRDLGSSYQVVGGVYSLAAGSVRINVGSGAGTGYDDTAIGITVHGQR